MQAHTDIREHVNVHYVLLW